METWCPGVNWGSKCQLSMSHLTDKSLGGTSGTHTLPLWVTSPEDLPVLTHNTVVVRSKVGRYW